MGDEDSECIYCELHLNPFSYMKGFVLHEKTGCTFSSLPYKCIVQLVLNIKQDQGGCYFVKKLFWLHMNNLSYQSFWNSKWKEMFPSSNIPNLKYAKEKNTLLSTNRFLGDFLHLLRRLVLKPIIIGDQRCFGSTELTKFNLISRTKHFSERDYVH